MESLVTKVVAADGGARAALKLGLHPDAVIGDMDSIGADAAAAFGDVMHEVAEQDSTDFDKALRSTDAPLVIGLGFLGKRVDHQLAAFTVLARYAHRRCVLIGKHDVVFLAPPEVALTMDVGARVSLFPMGLVRGASRGLEWPIDGLEFAPDGRVGTSNRASATQVHLRFDAPKMLVITPRVGLEASLSALQAAAPWPVRAL